MRFWYCFSWIQKIFVTFFFSKLQITGFCDLDTHYETYILLVDYLKLRIFFSRLFLTDIDFRKAGFILVYYLVGFRICAEISGMLKKNRLEKLVSPVIRSALLHASTFQDFARQYFFAVQEVSIVFSWEIDIKTGRVFEKV